METVRPDFADQGPETCGDKGEREEIGYREWGEDLEDDLRYVRIFVHINLSSCNHIIHIIHIKMLGYTSVGRSLIPVGWTTMLATSSFQNIYEKKQKS